MNFMHAVDKFKSSVLKLFCNMWQMVDAWGGWSLFQALLQTLKKVASKHGVSIPTVAVKYILDQVKSIFPLDNRSDSILTSN